MILRIANVVALLVSWLVFDSPALAQFETRAAFDVSQGSAPYSLVVGDFNRDGVLDVAEVNYLPSGTVEVLLGNGDGTFRLSGTYFVGVQPFYAADASLRDDGILDLVVGDSLSDNVWVMLGNGDGSFQGPVAYPTGGRPVQVSTGRFAGSDNLDVILLKWRGV